MFCNHWIAVDEVNLNRDQISVSVYSWGNPYRIPAVGTLSIHDFSSNFYGYVSGRLIPLSQVSQHVV